MTRPEILNTPLTDAELITLGARLDNDGPASRVDACRLLATIRDLQHTLRQIDIANYME
jgi:hypothetical protein